MFNLQNLNQKNKIYRMYKNSSRNTFAELILKEEIKNFKSAKNLETEFNLFPDKSNPLVYKFHILPPKNSAYADGMYKGKFVFTQKYPLEAPKVVFEGVIPFHPNVSQTTGSVCITFGSGTYYSLINVVDSFTDFFLDPEFSDPLDWNVMKFYNDKKSGKYMERVKINVEASNQQHEISDSEFPAWYEKRKLTYLSPKI